MAPMSDWLFEAPTLDQAGSRVTGATAARSGERRIIHEIISGFSRYQRTVQSLPPGERAKIARMARIVEDSFRPQRVPIRMILLVGHADRDVARGVRFEEQISAQRALAVQTALSAAIRDRKILARLTWHRVASGSRQPVAPNASAERDRARNRRVEILLRPIEYGTTDVPLRSAAR